MTMEFFADIGKRKAARNEKIDILCIVWKLQTKILKNTILEMQILSMQTTWNFAASTVL